MGFIELEFISNLPMDVPGPVLKVYGDPASDDSWQMDVSEDGGTWPPFGPQPEVVELDLARVGLKRVRFIRLTDTDPAGNAPELDAVEALHSEPTG